MKTTIQLFASILLSSLIAACGNTNTEQHAPKKDGHGAPAGSGSAVARQGQVQRRDQRGPAHGDGQGST